MKLVAQVALVVAAFTGIWSMLDRITEIEPTEYFDLYMAHPGARTSDLRWDATEDRKITRHELKLLQRALVVHDHSKCEEWFLSEAYQQSEETSQRESERPESDRAAPTRTASVTPTTDRTE